MNSREIRKLVVDDYADIGFIVDGKRSGVASEYKDSVPTYQAWYGDNNRFYSDLDVLMADHFFGGKSLNELAADGIEVDAI